MILFRLTFSERTYMALRPLPCAYSTVITVPPFFTTCIAKALLSECIHIVYSGKCTGNVSQRTHAFLLRPKTQNRVCTNTHAYNCKSLSTYPPSVHPFGGAGSSIQWVTSSASQLSLSINHAEDSILFPSKYSAQ